MFEFAVLLEAECQMKKRRRVDHGYLRSVHGSGLLLHDPDSRCIDGNQYKTPLQRYSEVCKNSDGISI